MHVKADEATPEVPEVVDEDWAQPAEGVTQPEVDPWLNLDSLLEAVFSEPLAEPAPDPESTRETREGER